MSKTIQVPSVKPEELIDIQISGYFLRQLQILLVGLGEQKSSEELKRILDKLKGNQPADDIFELQIHVTTALVASIEKAAISQKKVSYQDMIVDDEKSS